MQGGDSRIGCRVGRVRGRLSVYLGLAWLLRAAFLGRRDTGRFCVGIAEDSFPVDLKKIEHISGLSACCATVEKASLFLTSTEWPHCQNSLLHYWHKTFFQLLNLLTGQFLRWQRRGFLPAFLNLVGRFKKIEHISRQKAGRGIVEKASLFLTSTK